LAGFFAAGFFAAGFFLAGMTNSFEMCLGFMRDSTVVENILDVEKNRATV
jgi:hypothetical protein